MDLPPLDLSLPSQIGVSRCLALGILPLARQGEAVLILHSAPPSDEARHLWPCPLAPRERIRL